MPALQVRMTDEEYEQVRAAAEAAGVSMSEYVRGSLDGFQQLDARVRELEAWHERSKRMIEVYKRKGWEDPLEDPSAKLMKMSDFKHGS
jgi:mobilization protein NikA